MKLYTEEQVLQIIGDLNIEYFVTPEELLEEMELTSIELPSDEEISEVSMELYGKLSASLNDVLQYKAFKRGAKWMRDKIQGGEQ